MFKKIFFLSLVSLVSFYSGTNSDCFADELSQAKQNICSLIETGDFNSAEAATSKLIADYSKDSDIDKAVRQIAVKYRDTKNYQKAIELSRYVIATWPQSGRAVWSQMEIVMSNMLNGNEASVQAETNTLLANYSNDPNLPWALYVIGEQYRWTRNYDQAKELYERIIREHPNTECATKARIALINSDIITKIDTGDFALAEKQVDKMLTDFPTDSYLPEILFYIGQKFAWSRQYEQADKVYQQIAKRFPDSPFADKARNNISKTGQVISIISTMIDSGNYNQVCKAADDFIAQYGNEPEAPVTVFHIASRLEEVGQFALAGQVYERVISRYSELGWADRGRMGVQRTKVLSFAETGDEASEKATFDKMFNDFKGNSYLPTSVYLTAQGYYRMAGKAQGQGNITLAKKNFDKTLQTLDIVINQLPASEETPLALSMKGDCHYQLGDYQKAADTFQRIADNYPDYQNAWNALFMVAESYKGIKRSGTITESEANSKTRSVYEKLLHKYPDCPVIPVAQSWLNKNTSK